jgi:hypothetical protein
MFATKYHNHNLEVLRMYCASTLLLAELILFTMLFLFGINFYLVTLLHVYGRRLP